MLERWCRRGFVDASSVDGGNVGASSYFEGGAIDVEFLRFLLSDGYKCELILICEERESVLSRAPSHGRLNQMLFFLLVVKCYVEGGLWLTVLFCLVANPFG